MTWLETSIARFVESPSATYSIVPGTTPKVTMSAKESSCLPISDCILSNRATKPSRKSNTNAATTRMIPNSFSSFKKAIIALQPQSKLREVMALGMCFLMCRMFVNVL